MLSRLSCSVVVAIVLSNLFPGRASGGPPADFNGLSRANGKQIVRLDEHWLVVTPEPSGERAWLSIAPLDAAVKMTPTWKKVLLLAPDERGLFHSQGPSAVPPSLVVDGKGRVHAAWCDGKALWYVQAKVGSSPTDLFQRAAWQPPDSSERKPILDEAVLGDLAVDDDGRVWIAAVKSSADGMTTLCLGSFDGRWRFDELAKDVGFRPPVMHVAGGAVHLAWADSRGRLLYLRHRSGEKSEMQVLCKGGYHPNARNPSILVRGEEVLIAYESLYSQIEYARLAEGKWQSYQRLTALDDRLTTDVLHSPQLALDRHGVIWLFFSDTTRRFTYFARWLGSQWSDIYDARGIYYRTPRFEADLLPADWFAVEKHPVAEASAIGLALGNSLAPDMNEFHSMAVPTPQAAAGTTTLFLDLLETAALENLDLVLDQVSKEPRNPLVKPGPTGAFDQDRVLNHGTILFDGGKFRMWYGSAHRQRGVYWFRWMGTGYAESDDGIAWKKPPVHGSAAEQNASGNQLPLPWPCAVFKDEQEPDPARRYKVVQFDRHQLQLMAALAGEYDMDRSTGPGGLFQSADGLHWTSEPISISYPDGKPAELVVQSLFIDRRESDPARRWKAYGYAAPVARRRAGCLAYSADGKRWTAYPRNPILDPTVSQVPMVPAGPESQIHDTVVFPYRGYYLALFHAQHDARFLDVELAASRDGEHFFHIKHGHQVIPLGPPGSWDQQQILQTPAIVAHDKLWLYYGGQTMPAAALAEGSTNNELLVGGAGLGTLRLDGFTHLALAEGKSSGLLSTVPFTLRSEEPLCLTVNADCADDRTISVELVDVDTGQPIPGFTHDDCQLLAKDELAHVVAFRHGKRLPAENHRSLAFRFRFSGRGGSPKLYGFGFAGDR